MIPDEAVEAAARALWFRTRVDPWENSADYLAVEVCRHDARVALAAALPYLSEAARQPQRMSPTDWPDLPKDAR